ncbi:Protein FAR1-RELATED SEQUENCE [Abeliophyllum distichum]|uniref:Protein FAR1-RELATED SEQUENCE n=1 Tax=Abeliophyllum distichum TaxID=126358 RepID=A0ABD1UKN0_9LAMI
MNLFVVDDEYLEDDEIEIENSPCLNDDSVEKSNELVPEVGMKFKELDEVFEFYKNYASCVGFPVRKRNSRKFGMEKQFQEAYTISKFKEFQEEFSGMVYCRIIAVDEGPLGNSYQVLESIIFDDGMKKNTVLFYKDNVKLCVAVTCLNFGGYFANIVS